MRRTEATDRLPTILWGAGLVTGTLIAWQAWSDLSITARLLVSSPILIVTFIIQHAPALILSFAFTGMESAFGLLIATAFALMFGVISILYPRVGRIGFPFLVASQVVPIVCLAPMIILLFGTGPGGKVCLSFLVAFFPLLTNLMSGIASVPSAPQELMRILAAPQWSIMRHVMFPHCIDHFFSGLRIAAPLAVIGAIVAEFNGADIGIGKDIFVAAKRLEPELMMSGILAGALLSAILYTSVYFVERQLGSWYWEG